MRQKLLLISSGLLMLFLQMACAEFEEPVNDDKPKWEIYTTKDGLPSDTVWSINQDHNGVMWIGTENGLCKFNEINIEVVSIDIKINNITCTDEFVMVADEKGFSVLIDNTWLNSIPINQGCIDVEFYKNTFYSLYEHGMLYISDEYANDSVQVGSVNDIYIKNDSFWFCSLTGARRIFPNKLSYTKLDGLASNYCYAICEDHNNIIWVGTSDEKGLSKIDKDEVVNYNCGYIRTITEDIEGNIWAGSKYNGLYRIEPNGNITNYTMLDGLPNNKITDVFAAKDGAIWVSTEGGGIAKLIN